MKWEKKGLICNAKSMSIPWFKKNAMVPLPYLKSSNVLRIFLTMCDEHNIGRIGYVDVDPENPSQILSFSETPVLDTGVPGSFSEQGIVTSSLFEFDNKLYMYYSGYQANEKRPYSIFSGVAVSSDGVDNFRNLSDTPILDSIEGESCLRSSPTVIMDGEDYLVWYTSDARNGWVNDDGKLYPSYDMKFFRAKSPLDWSECTGETCISLEGSDEFGIAKGTIWRELGLYKALFSVRRFSSGYRLGYAYSYDGQNFVRQDHKVGIDVSESGWDSEMIAFPARIECAGKIYLFYSGNHYGQGGIGYAELIK
ncbi:hypothetical protein [Spartinivicinus ruber]|uniref:hypothetical protein n=1 Tax=Spartinivicinus ruber TaxID=2683272 RepID=UPI0013D0A97B|nr:hypothetical protein [Spartinivicinus ruber]